MNCAIKSVKYLLFVNDKITILKPILYSYYKILLTQDIKFHLMFSLETLIVSAIISFFSKKIAVKTIRRFSTQLCTNKSNIKYILLKHIFKFNVDLMLMFIYSVVFYVIYIKNNIVS